MTRNGAFAFLDVPDLEGQGTADLDEACSDGRNNRDGKRCGRC